MSTKKTAPTSETDFDPNSMVAPSGDFAEVSSSDRVEGWFVLQAGNAIQGILKGSFELPNRFDKANKKRVYRILVTSEDPAKHGPTLYTPADSAVAEDWPDGCEARINNLIGIDEKGFLQSLRQVPEGSEIWIACFGKEEPSEDYPQGAWKFRVLAKKPPVEPAAS
jgi:hypothetical protein